jgi:hypothetical protein
VSLKGLLEPAAWKKPGMADSEGPRRSNAPGLPDECEFTVLRYITLDGCDYPTHDAQQSAIAGYVRWADRRARPKRGFAVGFKFRNDGGNLRRASSDLQVSYCSTSSDCRAPRSRRAVSTPRES